MTPLSTAAANRGLEPLARAVIPGLDSGILTTLVACFVINALLFPTQLRLWREAFKEMSLRRHDLTVEHTSSERWAIAVSLVQTALLEAVALFGAIRPDAGHAFASLMGLLTLVVLFWAVQLGGYLLTGYAFAPKGEIRPWLRNFAVSQSVLGYMLLIPALGALFYPGMPGPFLVACAICFVVCRIMFYIKGFTIFYTSPASLFYFFLYLCTLEIIPLLAVGLAAEYFSNLYC